MKKLGKTQTQLNEMFSELIEIAVPEDFEYFKPLFISITSGRTCGFSGPNPVSYVEMKAYCELMDEQLRPYEIETLRLMDNTFVSEVSKEQPKGTK